MQPAKFDLHIVQGTTYRDTLRLMQPEFLYLPITAIAPSESGASLPHRQLRKRGIDPAVVDAVPRGIFMGVSYAEIRQ